MIKEFPIKFKSDAKCKSPAGENIFETTTVNKLDQAKKEVFHKFVAKRLFVAKQGRFNHNHSLLKFSSKFSSKTYGSKPSC